MTQEYVVNKEAVERSSMKEGDIGRDVLILQASENMVTGLTIVHPHSRTRGHAHPEREEHYYVLRGEGFIYLGEERYPIKTGDGILVPPVSVHTVENPNDEPLEFYWAAFADEPKLTHEEGE